MRRGTCGCCGSSGRTCGWRRGCGRTRWRRMGGIWNSLRSSWSGARELLVAASQEDVSEFMEERRANHLELRSIARQLSGLRGFYRWLLMDKRVGHDPTVNVETPASWKVLPKSLAETEVNGMLERTGMAARARGCGWAGAARPRDSGAAVCGWAAGGGDLRAARGGCAAGSAAGAGAGKGG